MRSSTTNVGLIGTGNIGLTHLISLSTLKEVGQLDVEIVGLCDTNKESLQRAADTFGVTARYSDYHDLLSDKNINMVYICTPTNAHQEIVFEAAKRRLDIFCEKPLAHNATQVSAMVEAVRRAKVSDAVGLVLRYDEFLLYAKRIIAENDLGTPMTAYIRDDQHMPVDFLYYSSWRGDRLIAGGGTLIEHSIHDIDLLRWFMGDVASVSATTRFYSGKQVEDFASATLTHKSGTVSSLSSIWHHVERPNERLLEFFFDTGYIGIHLGSGERYLEYQVKGGPSIRVAKKEAEAALLRELNIPLETAGLDSVEAITSLGNERYAALSYAVIGSLQRGLRPHPDFGVALEAHRVVDAAYQSASLGCPVAI